VSLRSAGAAALLLLEHTLDEVRAGTIVSLPLR